MRGDMKARWHGRYVEAVRNIQKHGITVNGCFIVGLDGHDPSIFSEVLDFAFSIPLYEVQITTLTAFPGTPLYGRLLREGRVLEPGRWDMCTLFDINYRPRGMTREELQKGLYWLGEQLYSAEATQKRREGFHRQWKMAHAMEG